MKKTIFFIVICVLFSCHSNKGKQEKIVQKNNFYKQSEMAALMLLMYKKNAENKQRILEGKIPKDFPESFLKIHTAQLTDPSDRDADFKTYSNFYLDNLKQVFDSSKDSLVEKHNATINSCITCHETTCVGPIPKIKKLIIRP